jgi:hypothetical protein
VICTDYLQFYDLANADVRAPSPGNDSEFREKSSGDGAGVKWRVRARAQVLDYIVGDETGWEREPIGATGARRRTFGVQAFRVLAADEYVA